ncbi:hypothetical protein U1Q18_025588 [Sarracenia purpurea var. burkii]
MKLWFFQAFCKFWAYGLLFARVSEAGCGPVFYGCIVFGYDSPLLAVAAFVGFGFAGFSVEISGLGSSCSRIFAAFFMAIWCLV